MFAIFQGELEARKSLKAFFLQPKLDILRNVFSFLKFCIKGPIVYYIQGGVGEGGGGREDLQFSKRLDFGSSILKMRRM